jgi:hypothetical protein
MGGSRNEHVGAARKLLRTLSSAPNPRVRASEIVRELARIEGLSSAEQTALAEMRTWLAQLPNVGLLKGHCDALVARFR